MVRFGPLLVAMLISGCTHTGAPTLNFPVAPRTQAAEPSVQSLPEYYRMRAAQSRVDRAKRVREMATLKTDMEQAEAELREAESSLRDAEIALAEAKERARSASSAPSWIPSSVGKSGGCGSRGGPGYRKANGRCASW